MDLYPVGPAGYAALDLAWIGGHGIGCHGVGHDEAECAVFGSKDVVIGCDWVRYEEVGCDGVGSLPPL
jgi:hypothetical protein